MNKKLKFFFVVTFCLFALGCKKESLSPMQGAVILVKDLKYTEVALGALDELTQNSGETSFKKYSLIFCGQAVSALITSHKLSSLIEDFMDQAVDIVVCRLGMKSLGINDADLISGLRIVENGVSETFRLQKKGYAAIAL